MEMPVSVSLPDGCPCGECDHEAQERVRAGHESWNYPHTDCTLGLWD